MGLFSFLKRKNGEPGAAGGTRARAGDASRLDSEAERIRQREIARATAAKIDAIELEMASDMFSDSEAAWGNVPRRAPAAATAAPEPEQEVAAPMLAGPPVAREAALLYASGQAQAAERTLRASLIGAGRSERLPWWMLFDLYQASGREQDFESIAIDYAIEFETPPPAWNARGNGQVQRQFAGITPTEAFSGVLREHIEPQLQRLLESNSQVVRLEFGGVRDATPQGCEQLLAGLAALRAAGRELVLAGADNLIAVLRPMLAIGERGASPAPWRLLLELLQLTDRAKDFEETAMDYRLTFETDPPAFEAPPKVTTATGGARPDAPAGDRFMLPPVVEGECGALLADVAAWARANDPAVLDCSRLARIDHDAASALEAQLTLLAAEGRTIELRELNNLVAPLLSLVGAGGRTRLFANKY